MWTGADVQIVFGVRDFEFAEEDVRHPHVVVLPSVNEDFRNRCLFGDHSGDRRGLNELGTCSDNRADFHFGQRLSAVGTLVISVMYLMIWGFVKHQGVGKIDAYGDEAA